MFCLVTLSVYHSSGHGCQGLFEEVFHSSRKLLGTVSVTLLEHLVADDDQLAALAQPVSGDQQYKRNYRWYPENLRSRSTFLVIC